jgi:methionine-rich copper-binding protein CopC
MSPRGRLVVVVLLVLAPLGIWLASTDRQAPPSLTLVSSSPVDASALRLTFSADADPALSHIAVATADGRQLEAGPVTAGPGHVLSVPVRPVGDGGYTVAYHVVGAGGDEASGIVRFGADAPAAAGHEHEHGIDPLSAILLTINLIVVITVVVLLLRRRPVPTPAI